MYKEKKLLDAGCGEGYLSRILAKQGAMMTAVDYAEKMIEIAKERTTSKEAIVYKQGNCEKLDFFNGCTIRYDCLEYGTARFGKLRGSIKRDVPSFKTRRFFYFFQFFIHVLSHLIVDGSEMSK